jgi:P-type Ca2+ transporter type 2C
MLSPIFFLIILVVPYLYYGTSTIHFGATAIKDHSALSWNRRVLNYYNRCIASQHLPLPTSIAAYQTSSLFTRHKHSSLVSIPRVHPVWISRPAFSTNALTIRGGSIVGVSALSDDCDVLSYNASNTDAGTRTMDELWYQIRTSPIGLTNVEAERRLQQYGVNSLQKPPTKSLLALIIEQFQDRLVQILLVVAIISAIFSVAEVATMAGDALEPHAMWKSFVEPMVIIAILVLNAAVSVWQSRSASDSLAALEQMQAAMCTVLRRESPEQMESQAVVTAAAALVPGDIIEIRTGDKIPADGRLISLTSSILTVDEGPLTGESVAVFKLPGNEGTVPMNATTISEQRGMLFAGTCVTQGSGRVLVTQTGMDTQFGRIQFGVLAAKAEQPKTPLQVKLDDFGETLSGIIFVICIAVWIVSIPKMNDPSFSSIWEGAIYYAKVSVALGVAAIPEGLPAVITLCLSLGTRRMAQRNVIVRNLPSVETLGCTSVICTDKTGTLTTNEVRIYFIVGLVGLISN